MSSSPSKRMMRLERKTSTLMFPLKKRVGLKKEAHHHPRCWSATSSSGEDDEGGEEEEEQFTPWSSSRASFDTEEEKEKDRLIVRASIEVFLERQKEMGM